MNERKERIKFAFLFFYLIIIVSFKVIYLGCLMSNSFESYIPHKLYEQVLNTYNKLFVLFQPLLGKSKKIVEIKRGLILKGKSLLGLPF